MITYKTFVLENLCKVKDKDSLDKINNDSKTVRDYIQLKEQLNVKVLSVSELAKKHNKPIEYIEKQLIAGAKVEAEHTKNKHDAKKIALAHIKEVPDYYVKLKKYVE